MEKSIQILMKRSNAVIILLVLVLLAQGLIVYIELKGRKRVNHDIKELQADMKTVGDVLFPQS